MGTRTVLGSLQVADLTTHASSQIPTAVKDDILSPTLWTKVHALPGRYHVPPLTVLAGDVSQLPGVGGVIPCRIRGT